jgi:hypothetical protein
MGQFSEASAAAQKALDAARAAKQTELAAEIAKRLDLYKAGKPVRETAKPGG